MDSHPKWLIARDSERKRLLIIHTEHPSFRAEVYREDDPKGLGPLCYALVDGRTLSNFVWYDAPSGDLVPLLAGVDEALARYRQTAKKSRRWQVK